MSSPSWERIWKVKLKFIFYGDETYIGVRIDRRLASLVQALGYNRDHEVQQQKRRRVQEWNLERMKNSPLHTTLQQMDDKAPELWHRLMYGAVHDPNAASRPIDLSSLESLAHHDDIKLNKSFDIDTVSVITNRLDTFKFVRVLLNRWVASGVQEVLPRLHFCCLLLSDKHSAVEKMPSFVPGTREEKWRIWTGGGCTWSSPRCRMAQLSE